VATQIHESSTLHAATGIAANMLVQLPFAIINGLATGVALFLVAAGLTLVFGILRILNFAHGAFFMIGAYVAFTLVGRGGGSLSTYIVASLVAGLAVGLLGIVTDRIVLRRLRDFDESYMLIATFGLLTFCQGLVQLIWGVNYNSVQPPEILSGIVQFGSIFVPAYSLFLIAVGMTVFIVLDVAIHRLWFGKVVQALAVDSWMSGLCGINVPLVFMAVVMAAFFLAGLAGGLLLPNQSLSPELGNAYTLQAFIAVIIGGLGNIRGAFVAAILLGLIESLNGVLLPNTPGLAIFVAMVLFLLVRPNGLFAQETI
jgi:branched-subunit amino acid ABC-type transport system permease component